MGDKEILIIKNSFYRKRKMEEIGKKIELNVSLVNSLSKFTRTELNNWVENLNPECFLDVFKYLLNHPIGDGGSTLVYILKYHGKNMNQNSLKELSASFPVGNNTDMKELSEYLSDIGNHDKLGRNKSIQLLYFGQALDCDMLGKNTGNTFDLISVVRKYYFVSRMIDNEDRQKQKKYILDNIKINIIDKRIIKLIYKLAILINDTEMKKLLKKYQEESLKAYIYTDTIKTLDLTINNINVDQFKQELRDLYDELEKGYLKNIEYCDSKNKK